MAPWLLIEDGIAGKRGGEAGVENEDEVDEGGESRNIEDEHLLDVGAGAGADPDVNERLGS